MKILHTADIHLGVKNSRLPKDKQALLKDETIYNIRNLFEIAERECYDVVLICGDLFHAKNIASKFSKAFFDAVEKFEKPVIYVSGNHDENFIMPLILPKNFVVIDENNQCFSYGNFNFYGGIYENWGELDSSKSNIILLHGNIENTRDCDYFDINKYLNKGFDYIALGHVHTHKKYKSENDVFAYPGSLFSNGFDECGDRGYISLEMQDKTIKTLNFCPFSARKFVICECNISNLTKNREIIELIEKKLMDLNANYQDLVRVILKGAVSEDCDKSIPFILSRFDTYFHFEIEDKTTLKIDIDNIKKEKLSFKYEFISLIEESELDEESKRIVCEIGLEALKGEDINL